MAASSLFVVGANHRSCSGLVRERLFTEELEVPAVLARLRAAGLTQILWLATCDRIEIQGVHPQPAEAALAGAAVMAERAGLTPAALADQLYTLTGAAALRHVFAVAGSLDSQVIGEPHILGQVKAAHRQTLAAGTTGPELEAVLQAAFAAAKRVRSETTVAESPTSIAAAAVQIARDLHGELARCGGLLLGLGDMGVLMVDQLREAGLTRLTVTATADARAEAAARRMGGHHAPFAQLEAALAGADIVVAATGLGRYIVEPALIAAVLKRRRRRPVFLIDAAVPADIDPAVGGIDGAFVYDLEDLERVAVAGRVSREAAAAQAWTIIDQSVGAFYRGRAERAAVPAVAALRGHFERVRERLLIEQGSGLDAAEATRLLVNRLLHQPSEALRRMAADTEGGDVVERAMAERLLNRLFGLDGAADDVVNGAMDRRAGPEGNRGEER